MKTIINSLIEDFNLPAFHNGDFLTISSDRLKGKWNILFFYPNDFCFVCPTELADMANIYNDLQLLDVEVYAICSDSHHAHKAWHRSSPSVGQIQFPMLSDPTCKIGKTLGVVSAADIIRSTFLINPEGRIKLAEYHESGVGRNAKELLRKVKLVVEKSAS